jgi:hypothetical protein
MQGEDESDQLPESGPGGQTPDDSSGGSKGDSPRDEATENPGGADGGDEDPGDATGGGASG